MSLFEIWKRKFLVDFDCTEKELHKEVILIIEIILILVIFLFIASFISFIIMLYLYNWWGFNFSINRRRY